MIWRNLCIFVPNNMRKMAVFALLTLCVCSIQAQEKVMMLVGTYTDGGSKGIYTYSFNQENGPANRYTQRHPCQHGRLCVVFHNSHSIKPLI